MLRGSVAKVAALVVGVVVVLVVPGVIRSSDRAQPQRVETESPVDESEPEDRAAEGAARALAAVPGSGPSVGGPSVGAAVGDAAGPRLLDLVADDGPPATVAGDVAQGDESAGFAADGVDADGSAPTAEVDDDGSAGTGGDDGPSATAVPAETTSTAPPTTTPVPPIEVGPAPGTDQQALYVDPGRGAGSNPGTEDQPFRRPIEALSIAEPGTTIYLRGGTYDTATHSGFSIRRSGTPDRWIRITAYPGERVELVAGGQYDSGFEVLGASYVEVSGLVLRGRDDSIHGSGVFVKDGAHDVRIIGNQISNFGGAGISVIGSSRVLIEGNDVRNNAFRSFYQGSGISLYKMAGPTNSGFSNIVRGNYVVNNRNEVPHQEAGRVTDGNCIIMDRNNESGYTGWTLIENNVCAENGGRGVHSYRSSFIEARNNTLYHNLASDSILHGRGEMTVGEGRDVYFYNNLVINRPGIASYVDNQNTNTRFVNNHVMSDPPPGEGNQLLPAGTTLFSSTDRGGPVDQFRPLGGAGLGATADASKQSSNDFSGRSRPATGTVGAFEP